MLHDHTASSVSTADSASTPDSAWELVLQSTLSSLTSLCVTLMGDNNLKAVVKERSRLGGEVLGR